MYFLNANWERIGVDEIGEIGLYGFPRNAHNVYTAKNCKELIYCGCEKGIILVKRGEGRRINKPHPPRQWE